MQQLPKAVATLVRHLYAESVGGMLPAVCDLSMVDDGTWEVNRINTPAPSRGIGHGRRLLRQVTADADLNGVTLVLRINPYGPLDREALAGWYGRNGFKFTEQPNDFEMIRHPK